VEEEQSLRDGANGDERLDDEQRELSMNLSRASFLARVARVVAIAIAAAAGAATYAHAQCTYPLLGDDFTQTFTTSPTYARFVQSAGRWAAAAVRSSGTANWDVGFSLNTAAFPTCLTAPVVASQQSSGIDFVLGDFAIGGTGTRYAPIARAGGSGGATLEWDSGARTAVMGARNAGAGLNGLIDVWNIDLVAGTSYDLGLYSDNNGDFKMYVFQRGGANSWRQKSDAVLVFDSNANGPHVFTPTTTGKHAIVVTNEANVTTVYYFFMQQCTAPQVLADNVPVLVPPSPNQLMKNFAITPLAPGFHTIAFRPGWQSPVAVGVGPRSALGALPPCDYAPSVVHNSFYAPRVFVGDFASGYLPIGNTYWVGIETPALIGDDAWIEYDTGDTPLVVGAAPTTFTMGDNDVVRTFRANLTAGQPVRVHAAGALDAKWASFPPTLWVFRPFDGSVPGGQGWSTIAEQDPHRWITAAPLQGPWDFTLTPPVTGPYAFVISKDFIGDVSIELGLSPTPCLARQRLFENYTSPIVADPAQPFAGALYGLWHTPYSDWSVMAVRARASYEDWNIQLYDKPSGGPGGSPMGCLSGPLVSTNNDALTSDVDFLVRRERPLADRLDQVGTYRVFPVSGFTAGGEALFRFDEPYGSFSSDYTEYWWTMRADELVESWRVDFTAGNAYTINFNPGISGTQLFVFESASTCTTGCEPEYFRLGDEVLRATAGNYTYAPQHSGEHLLVLVNQIGSEQTSIMTVSLTTVGIEPEVPLAIATPRFDSVAPNPAPGGALRFGFSLPRAARVGFEIINLAGRRVTRVEAADFAAGPNARAWIAVDDAGRKLTPGVYFARMLVDGAVAGRKKIAVTP
jgi:hypothetical protein